MRLGTLGYLPLEIRQKIWCAVIENYKERYLAGLHDITVEDVMDLDRYLYFTPEHKFSSKNHNRILQCEIFNLHCYQKSPRVFCGRGTMYFRYVSPEAKIELENAFIFTNSFGFFCPKALDHFLNSLSASHGCLLQSISIRLFGCHFCTLDEFDQEWPDERSLNRSYRAWTAVVERLPATLKSIKFELGWEGILSDRWPGVPPDARSVKKALRLLEIMTKKAQRQAPKAQISLSGQVAEREEMLHVDQEILQSVLDEVDPYSEAFKGWSIRSWRDGITQREEL